MDNNYLKLVKPKSAFSFSVVFDPIETPVAA